MGIIPEKKAKVKPGDVFGHWVVLGQPFSVAVKKEQRRTFVVCKCECGNISVALQDGLIRKTSLSCGCELFDGLVKHGGSRKSGRTRLYTAWNSMRQRCYNQKHPEFHNYGGRGILVCDEWLLWFSEFREWAERSGYQPWLSIDRIDVNLGYSPGNCRWISQQEQCRNMRKNRKITAFGEEKLLCEWVADSRCSVSGCTITSRIAAGLNAEDAITRPRGWLRTNKEVANERDFTVAGTACDDSSPC